MKMNLIAVLAAALLGACASAKPAPDPLAEREAGLSASDPKTVGAPAPGSPEEKAAADRFTAFLSDLSTGTIKSDLRKVYADRLYFNDTLKTIRDSGTLEKYFLSSDDAMASYGLKVEQVASTPDGVFVRWKMSVVFRRFRKGERNDSIGITHVRFDKDGRVVYHQDYWDSGSNLYEKIPVLGALIRAVKRRL